MSLAITHFAVGAGVLLLLQPLLLPNLRYRRTLVVASGLWALVPDVFYVVPGMSDVFSNPALAPYGDLFWLHTTMDGLVMGRGTRPNAALALGFLTICAVLGDVLAAASSESGQAADGSAVEPPAGDPESADASDSSEASGDHVGTAGGTTSDDVGGGHVADRAPDGSSGQ